MLVLVTGATGFVGQHLTRALLAEGHRVRALGRNPDVCDRLSREGAEVVRADLREVETSAACDGADWVCHVGALSAPWGRAADFHATNVGGTAHVVAGCRRHRVRRLVHLSSPAVVFDGRNQVDQTESAPYPRRFNSAYARTKKQAEVVVHAAMRDGLEAVILRPKAIFGPGDTTLLPRLLAAARRGRLPQVGDGRNRVDLTYVDNVVHAIRLALAAERTPGNTYTITSGEHVLLWSVIRTLLRHQGLESNLRPVPYRVVHTLAALLELRARLFGGEPLLTRYTAAVLGRTQTYDIRAARRDLGYRPLVSVAEGVERTLAALSEARDHEPACTR